jgi:YVTN family beta-propeller protein
MEFRILGALEVRDDGGSRIPLGAGKQRAVLAFLLLHGNEVVATERLIDELWGESPPETARKALQIYVSRLRKALGTARIGTHEPGYVLELDPDELDLARFERMVEQARTVREKGEDARAAGLLREALALWTGSPLADLIYEPFAQREIARLEELRLAALEERIDAELAIGHGADLVGELEALVIQHPYRERVRGQLMLALYRAGRQADALAVYQETRRLLVDELGIEPSPALQRLEGAILRQESALETVLEEPASGDTSTAALPEPPTARRRRRWRVAAAAAALALAAGALAVGLTRPWGRDFLPALDEDSVGLIDADAVGIEAQVGLHGRPSAIAVGGGFVWVASEADSTVSRVEPELRSNVHTLPVEGGVGGLAYGNGSLWVTNPRARTVAQINPDTLAVVQTIPVGNGPGAIAAGEQAVWVANTIDATVSRIDVARGGDAKSIPLATGPTGIAVGARAVWVSSEAEAAVYRLDPRSGAIVERIPVGNGPSGVAVSEEGVWVANRQDGTVSRIDPQTNSVVATIPVGLSPVSVAARGGAVWVANEGDGTIMRIDAATGRVDKTLPLASSPNGLVATGDTVWVSTLPSLSSHRGGVLRVEGAPERIDPARENLADPQVLTLAYDGLLAYRHVGGIAGASLVGNLALRVPTPSDQGKTYTFQLRRNIRYSSGAPVRASDFRYSLERLLTVNRTLAPSYYNGIVGAAECPARPPERCDLSTGIEVDDAAGTITIHLARADPDFLHKLAEPLASVVPSGTPLRAARDEPIPGTGPYRVASADFRRGGSVRLVRNPYFRVWSADARPDGYPDEIRFLREHEGGLAEVERGDADFGAFGAFPGELLKDLLTKYGGRLHDETAPVTFWVFLNARVPPFDDVRVRRALNFAIDRGEIVALAGGAPFAAPTCQILPPVFPGYRPYCPYTLGPNAAGTWIDPNLAQAKALVAASGTRGMRVEYVVPGCCNPLTAKTARYFVRLLRELGYRSSLRIIPDFSDYLGYVADSRHEAQIGHAGWIGEKLAPSEFLQRLFSCASFLPHDPANLNASEFCDREIDAAMNRAGAEQTTDPARANELWAEIDHALVHRAVVVPTISPRYPVFVSNRVGNYQSHPLWGTLLDQLWVR